MNWNEIVERQIVEAQERGEFDNLPGKGKPLVYLQRPKISVDEKLGLDSED